MRRWLQTTALSSAIGVSGCKGNTSLTRDANVGFTIVCAGQSTCVPPPAAR